MGFCNLSNRLSSSSILLFFYLAMCIPVIVGHGGMVLPQLLVLGLIIFVSSISGWLIIKISGLEDAALPNTLFQLLVGFLAFSLLLLVVIEICNVGVIAATSFSTTIIIVILLALFAKHRKIFNEFNNNCLATTCELKLDILLVVIVTAVVPLWTRNALMSVRLAEDSGFFRAWSDFFLQASELRYLELYPSFGGETMYLSGMPQLLYHRGSYALSSLFSALSNTAPLETAMYFWVPTGIIFLCVGAYLLGCALGGRGTGLVSVIILFSSPDPAMYWKNNSLFSFHWLIQVAPGTGYALGAALSGFALYVVGVRQGRFRLIATGALFIVASAFFRMHIAIPAIITYGLLMLISWSPTKPWYRIALFTGSVITLTLTVILAEQIPLAPHFISGKKDGIQYINIILGVIPAGYIKLQQMWFFLNNEFLKGLLGYLAILPLELGVFFPLMLTSITIACRTGVTAKLWTVPLLLIMVHYALTIYMPTPMHGDISDWSHRSFPLIYAVVVVTTSSVLWNFCSEKLSAIRLPIIKQVVILTFVLLGTIVMIFVPWYFGRNIQKGFIGDGESATSTKVSSETFIVSRFIFKQSKPGDIFVFSGGDPLAVMVSLTGRQAYFSRESFYEKLGGNYNDIIKNRVLETKTIATIEDMVSFGLKRGVRWFVLQQSDNPILFHNVSKYSELTVNNVSVFDLTKLHSIK